MNRWLFLWRRVRAQIWFRASLYAGFGVGAALVAVFAAPFVPREMAERLGGESVQQILTILASSLLAVATFSLGAWVTAYTSVSQAATPRAAALVTSDEASQKSLATFVGAFLYAVVAVTAVNAHYYGPGGRAVLYLTSLAVVGLVAFRLLGWINRLSRLARLGHMIELVEKRTATCLAQQPPARPRRPLSGAEIHACETGYVQNIDLPYLRDQAAAHGVRVQILASVGAFRRRGEILARVDRRTLDPDLETRLGQAFSVARNRTFDQDPRYGLIVLGEIGARALSPGVNDPGTAIQIVGVAVRLLDDWARLETGGSTESKDGVDDPVLSPPLEPDALLDDVLGPLIRYGSADLALAIRLQKALSSLASAGTFISPAARRVSREALARAKSCLTAAERQRLTEAARAT
jgi:uncharacterized membrane protein